MNCRTKKERILRLYKESTKDISKIATQVKAYPSYVAHILRKEGLIDSYSDLYTHVNETQNVYSEDFKGILSFKTPLAAKRSIHLVDKLYRNYKKRGDRAGQHQAMVVALVGMNRARWIGKMEEGAIFANWLKSHLVEEEFDRSTSPIPQVA